MVVGISTGPALQVVAARFLDHRQAITRTVYVDVTLT